MQICWDQWYPEGSRLTALGGAQVIFYPTSIGWHPHEKAEFGAAQLDAWRTIQRAHAIANGVYVAVVNRVGYEGKPENGDPGLEFWGNSVCCRSIWAANGRGSFQRQRGNSRRRVRSREERRHAPQLAVPARPSHRRVPSHHESLAWRVNRIRMPTKKSASRKIKARKNAEAPVETQTPFELGYAMPAEWEHHHATWLGWPHEVTDWPGKFPAIPWAYAEIVRNLARVERVYLLVENAAEEKKVRDILAKSGVNLANVDFLRVPTDRGWMRDSGPISVKNANGDLAYTHWRFNGWAKYANHKRDAVAATLVNRTLRSIVLGSQSTMDGAWCSKAAASM